MNVPGDKHQCQGRYKKIKKPHQVLDVTTELYSRRLSRALDMWGPYSLHHDIVRSI